MECSLSFVFAHPPTHPLVVSIFVFFYYMFFVSHRKQTELEMITGACAGVMQVDLYHDDRLITPLRNDNAALGSYPIEDGMRIHVVGNTIFVSDHIDRFELTDKHSDDADNAAERRKHQYGYANDVEMKAVVRDKAVIEEERLASLVNIGDQCLVRVRGPRRVGTVMYKGPLDDRDGVFVGVKFDGPLGIHDGR